MRSKRIVSFLISLCMVVSTFSAFSYDKAGAAETKTAETDAFGINMDSTFDKNKEKANNPYGTEGWFPLSTISELYVARGNNSNRYFNTYDYNGTNMGAKIAVFCGSSFGNNDDFISSTKALGKAFARNNITLVYGGGYRGLMGALAEAVQTNNGHVIGVLPEIFNNEKVKIKQVEDELIVTKDMHARKKQIYDIADAFIILPGGIGTFDEFFEIFTWKQIGYHEKNIAIYNINGFYDTLLSFLKECCIKGFLREEVLNSLIVKTDPDEIIEEIKTRKTTLPSKI